MALACGERTATECAGCSGCGGDGGSESGCGRGSVPLDPRLMTAAERRRWLEQYKRHLEERLAEVNEQLRGL